MRGMSSSKTQRTASGSSLGTSRNGSANGRNFGSYDGDEHPLEVTSVSYLTVPQSARDLRRPSTADVFIEKLKVNIEEKYENRKIFQISILLY